MYQFSLSHQMFQLVTLKENINHYLVNACEQLFQTKTNLMRFNECIYYLWPKALIVLLVIVLSLDL